MSEDRVTIEKIIKMFREMSGFKADATQTDALQLLLETFAAQQALAYESAPNQLIESLLNSLHHQASQILDTGGRMRLSKDGQLDARDQPLALATDVKMVDNRIGRLHSALNEMLTAQLEMNQRQEEHGTRYARQAEMVNTALEMVAQDLRNDREAAQAAGLAVIAQRQAVERLTSAVEALTHTVLETMAARGHVEEVADQVKRLRQVVEGVMQSPRPQPAVEIPDAARDELADWERELLAGQVPTAAQTWEAMVAPLGEEEIAGIKQDMADGKLPVRKIRLSSHDPAKSPHQPQYAGCFFNEDGSITCRICGQPKMPSQNPKESAYYKDRQAATGFKSDCKDCEKRIKAEKAA